MVVLLVLVGGVIKRFFLYTTALASASLLTAALIVEGVSFRVAGLAMPVIDELGAVGRNYCPLLSSRNVIP